jgi:hypothetical protein
MGYVCVIIASLGPYVALDPFSALDSRDFDNAVIHRRLWGRFEDHPEFLYLELMVILSFKSSAVFTNLQDVKS